MAGKIWTPLLRSVAVPPDRTGEPAAPATDNRNSGDSTGGTSVTRNTVGRRPHEPKRFTETASRDTTPRTAKTHRSTLQTSLGGYVHPLRPMPSLSRVAGGPASLRTQEVGAPHQGTAQVARDGDERRRPEERGPIGDETAAGRRIAGARREHGRADRAHGPRDSDPAVPCEQGRGLDERRGGQSPSRDGSEGAHRRPRAHVGDGDGAPVRAAGMNGDELGRGGGQDQPDREMNEQRMKCADERHVSMPLGLGPKRAVLTRADRTLRRVIPGLAARNIQGARRVHSSGETTP